MPSTPSTPSDMHDAMSLPSSRQGIKYPKLRTRQQVTLRYKNVERELAYWRAARTNASSKLYPEIPRVQAKIERHIAECEAQLDALCYALNDVV